MLPKIRKWLTQGSCCPTGAVGIYVPGGTAVLPSSALMLSVPAGIAGCKTIVLATPPRPDGTITPEVLWCAKRAGVTHILKAGGAQAVAAMAWGTETCPKVCKYMLLQSEPVPSLATYTFIGRCRPTWCITMLCLLCDVRSATEAPMFPLSSLFRAYANMWCCTTLVTVDFRCRFTRC